MDSPVHEPLISVVIPCYNHGRYLPDAVTSVVQQTYNKLEIIVVDDGSTDDTAAVSRKYPSVRYVYQINQGLAAARNKGLDVSTGDFVVFLDADDRLLPNALQSGKECMEANPDCAFAFGCFRRITRDGAELPETLPQRSRPQDSYQAFLEGNFIEMHATVIYRRSHLLSVGGFDPRLRECEDYDLYLRITRNFAIAQHQTLTAEYRQHETNMSHDAPRMLTSALAVLRAQWEHAKSDRLRRRSYGRGVRAWKDYYGERMLSEVLRLSAEGRWDHALEGMKTLVRLCGFRTPMVTLLYVLPQAVRAEARQIAQKVLGIPSHSV